MSRYCPENFDGNGFKDNRSCGTHRDESLDHVRQDIYGGGPKVSEFHGIDLAIIKIGVRGNSLDFGVDVGIARTEIKVGQETGISVGAGIEGVASSSVGGGIAIDRSGLHGGVGTSHDAFNTIGGSGHVGADLGSSTGTNAEATAYVGPAHAGVRGSAGVGADGLNAGAGANAGVDRVVGLHGGAQMSLSGDSSLSAGAGGYVGPYNAGATGGVYSDGDRYVRPGVDGYAYDRNRVPGNVAGAPAGQYEQAPRPLPAARQDLHQDSIEITPLPAPRESFDTVSRHARQEVLNHSVIVAQKGQTYLDILQQANPTMSRESLESEVAFIKHINHNRPIKAGAHVATLSPEEIDWKTRVLTAQRMGYPAPQS